MGIITPSFLQLFLEELHQLQTQFKPTLKDRELQRAFDALVEIWRSESTAMQIANLPATLDILNLMANVHNRAESEEVERKLDKLIEAFNEIKNKK
jgi:hypothetical protein